MEASSLTTASPSGVLRRTPLLRFQPDERLVALMREGREGAFEVLFNRYQSRLLAFCRHLVGSPQDAEDVLQEVFAAAHAAILADNRPINARPWLYRIARNRSLNHLRKPTADGVDSMDVHPHENGTSTLERVQRREELRAIVADVHELPETQRTALVLREIDDLSYTDIAQAMGTTLPSVKSLLVRARMSLAESSEARILTCDEVRLELAEAAEGLRKLAGSTRRHVRDCPSCSRHRRELRSSKAPGALAPFGLLALLRKLLPAKLGGSSGAGGTAGTAGTTGGAAGTAGGVAGTAGGVAASGSSSITLGGVAGAANTAATGIGGALGAKAAVGVATAALLAAGAVSVAEKNLHSHHATAQAGRAGVSATTGTTGGVGSSAVGLRGAAHTAGAAGAKARTGSGGRRAGSRRPHAEPRRPVKPPAAPTATGKPAAGSGHIAQGSPPTKAIAPGTPNVHAASNGTGAVAPHPPPVQRVAGGVLRTRPATTATGRPAPPKLTTLRTRR